MNVPISSALLSVAVIFLADSIRQLQPHKRSKKRKGRTKKQSVTRVNRSVIDLTQTDLRRGGAHD